MIQKQFARLRMDVLSQKMDEPSDEATVNPAAKAPCHSRFSTCTYKLLLV